MSTRLDPRRYRSNETECESCGALFRDSSPTDRGKYEPAQCSECRELPDPNRRH